MNNFNTKLKVFSQAHHLVLEIYKVTKRFPDDERYGLTSQLRRASVSIPANIVEGKARGTIKEYLRYLYIARASLEEVKYYLYLSRDLDYLTTKEYEALYNLCDTVGKLLAGLIKNTTSKMNTTQ